MAPSSAATRGRPFRSRRATIAPARPRRTASGLQITRVRFTGRAPYRPSAHERGAGGADDVEGARHEDGVASLGEGERPLDGVDDARRALGLLDRDAEG